MYKRKSNTGHVVEWSPERTELAAQAIEEQKGGGVPEDVEVPDDAKVEVDDETAKSIRHRYWALVYDKDIRAALDEGDDELAEELKEEYQGHTGEEWQE